MSLPERVRAYVQLTKPRIILLFGITGLAGLILEGSLNERPLYFWMVFVGMILTAGSANALNQYLDRDIDAMMSRTRVKRPLPKEQITPENALIFGFITGIIATAMLYYFGNLQTAFWGVFTILFYTVIYTAWLKRRTPYNIVIGGAAGATAPLIGWAAGSGSTSPAAWILFALIFMWTPPHFWALALCIKDDYAQAKVPMLPCVVGDERTRRQILYYTLTLVPISLLMMVFAHVGWIYVIGSTLLGVEFLRRVIILMQKKDQKTAMQAFGFSIVYLLVLFLLLIVDAFYA